MADAIRSVGAVGSRTVNFDPRASPESLRVGQRAGESFEASLSRALGEVQQVHDDASTAVAAFLRGEPVELHDVMAAVEEAGIALELLIQVRDRLIEAYRTVSNMQS
jgi:flagellar hook-basal body complex protein FliE